MQESGCVIILSVRSLQKARPVIAVELDPPFDAQMEKLMNGAHALADTPADIITIADSPLARSRADALLTAVKISRKLEFRSCRILPAGTETASPSEVVFSGLCQ